MGFFDSITGFGKAIVSPFIDAGKAVVNTIGKAGSSTARGVGKLVTGDWRGALEEGSNVMNTFGQGARDFSTAVGSMPIIGDALGALTDPITGAIDRTARRGRNLIGAIGGMMGYNPRTTEERERDNVRESQKDIMENLERFPLFRDDRKDNIVREMTMDERMASRRPTERTGPVSQRDMRILPINPPTVPPRLIRGAPAPPPRPAVLPSNAPSFGTGQLGGLRPRVGLPRDILSTFNPALSSVAGRIGMRGGRGRGRQ